MTAIDSNQICNYHEIKEGNRLPFFKDNQFSTGAFHKREVVLEDSQGKKYSLGAHYNGYGKGIVKGNNLCFRVKTVNGKEMVELDFKINHAFQTSIDFFRYSTGISPRGFSSARCQSEMGGYSNIETLVFYFPNSSSISIGDNPGQIGMYNRVIVRFPKETSLAQLKTMLSAINLADVVEPSSHEDLQRIKIGQLFRLFFPEEATLYERTPEFFNLPLNELKAKIVQKQPKMQEIFDQYLPKLTRYKPLKGRVRYKVESISQKCAELGAHALVVNIGILSVEEGLNRTVSILKMGLLSSELRLANGMGIQPFNGADVWLGGSDSVFTQLITQKLEYVDFAYHYYPSKIALILDLEILETVTYQSFIDSMGTRSLSYDDRYLNRPNIFDFVQNSHRSALRRPEIMVKDRVPPSAIKGILVRDENTQQTLLQHLRQTGLIEVKENVETIFNVPVHEFIRLNNEESFKNIKTFSRRT